MFNKICVLVLFALALAGCSKCILTQSEYYDITGKVYAPKAEDVPVDILAAEPVRPYEEIGVVKVMARWGTSRDIINKELKRRAAEAGADAVMAVQYGEDTGNVLPMCGKLVATRRNVTAVGKAIVFTDKK